MSFLNSVPPVLYFLFFWLLFFIYAISRGKKEHDYNEDVRKEQLYAKVRVEHKYPYSFIVENNSKERKMAILYGFHKYLLCANFGSEKGISITPESENITYFECVSQSAYDKFTIRKIHLKSTIADLRTMVIMITVRSSNGDSCQFPLLVNKYLKEEEVKQIKVGEEFELCFDFEMKIDGNTSLEFHVNPNSKFIFKFFYNTESFIEVDTPTEYTFDNN